MHKTYFIYNLLLVFLPLTNLIIIHVQERVWKFMCNHTCLIIVCYYNLHVLLEGLNGNVSIYNYNKQNNTWMLGNIKFISCVKHISLLHFAHSRYPAQNKYFWTSMYYSLCIPCIIVVRHMCSPFHEQNDMCAGRRGQI